MLQIYKTTEKITNEIENIEAGCWINLKNPSTDEIKLVSEKTGLEVDFLRAALDDEETSRLDFEEDQQLVIVDIPFMDVENNSVQYQTIPLGIILNDEYIVTVCLRDSRIIEDFMQRKVKNFYTFKKSRFILQMLLRVATYYLSYLRQIDKTSSVIESRLHRSMKNKELIQLLSLEKSLVYFSTSLKQNEVTLEKMLKLSIMRKYPEDQDVLEDVIVENKQAIEMASIYSNTLSGTMDAFASIISNNQNTVMKFLASITIIMTIPNIISSIYGMNFDWMPMLSHPYGFFIILGIMGASCGVVIWILAKKDMFL